ncbi:MAG: leucine-rich repeat domain-containing protein, partial [Eubacteriales bacterium]|nr:leucine-rich repeat domain-containing protein [Eubacteriales bacterium]
MKAKKFCIIALVLAIVLLIMPISESRAEEEPDVKKYGNYEYIVLDDGTACIKSYYGIDEKVIIPGELDGIIVTSIGDSAFSFCKKLTEVTIPDSVENIGDNAFYFCISLTEIKIPDGVQSIGNGAFYCCKNLTEIKIPNSVENIGENPFSECENLLNINISANHPTLFFIDNVLIYKPEKKIVSYLITSKESKYQIPEGIETIGDYAFAWSTNLTEVKIPD